MRLAWYKCSVSRRTEALRRLHTSGGVTRESLHLKKDASKRELSPTPVSFTGPSRFGGSHYLVLPDTVTERHKLSNHVLLPQGDCRSLSGSCLDGRPVSVVLSVLSYRGGIRHTIMKWETLGVQEWSRELQRRSRLS